MSNENTMSVEPPVTPSGGWRSRIVGHGEEDPKALVPNPRNWRLHPKAQTEALKGALTEVGWVQDILVNRRTGHVVDGHARIELARERGEAKVPVLYVDLSPEEEALVLATLDPLSALAEPDPEKLSALLGDAKTNSAALQALLEDLAGQAAEGMESKAGLSDPDEVPEPPAEPRSKTGDLYLLGEHRLLVGDSRDAEGVKRLLAGEKASCLWTDPPYGVDYEGQAGTIQNDSPEGLEDLLQRAFAVSNEVLGEGAAVYVAHPAGAQGVVFANQFLKAGWRIHQTLVWVKDTLVLGHADYHYRHEPILFGYRPGEGRRGRGGRGWYGDNAQTSVFEIPRPKRSEEHPTMKPVELVEAMLRNSSKPGDLIYEPFAGSGTTLLACERLGRRCRAVELDPKYADVVVARWEQFTGKTAVREEVPGAGA